MHFFKIPSKDFFQTLDLRCPVSTLKKLLKSFCLDIFSFQDITEDRCVELMVTSCIKKSKIFWVLRRVRIESLSSLDFQNWYFWLWCLSEPPQNFLFWNPRLLFHLFVRSRSGSSFAVEILDKGLRKGLNIESLLHLSSWRCF